jgi:hypothetical protein
MSDDSAEIVKQALLKEVQSYKHGWATAKRLLEITEARLLTAHDAGYKQGYAAASVEIDALRATNELLTNELEELKACHKQK